jgi:hypothetical protein
MLLFWPLTTSFDRVLIQQAVYPRNRYEGQDEREKGLEAGKAAVTSTFRVAVLPNKLIAETTEDEDSARNAVTAAARNRMFQAQRFTEFVGSSESGSSRNSSWGPISTYSFC